MESSVEPASTVSPLANPKKLKLSCELCQKPAYLMCNKCRVTFYCNEEHRLLDYNGIHERICPLLPEIRNAPTFFPLQEERDKLNSELLNKKKQLMELTYVQSRKFLYEGRYEQAIPAAMQNLKINIELHGAASFELVPSYLLLAEASIGLKRLEQSEDYLSQAEWTVLKTQHCSNELRYKLFRNLGLLFTAKNEYTEALRYFADDVYHASLDNGTNHINVTGGYYYMANVFRLQGRWDCVDSFYLQILDIWTVFLKAAVKEKLKRSAKGRERLFMQDDDDSSLAEPRYSLDEGQQAEAKMMLLTIFEHFMTSVMQNKQLTNATKQSGLSNEPMATSEDGALSTNPSKIGASAASRTTIARVSQEQLIEMCHTVAMLFLFVDDYDECKDFIAKAFELANSFANTKSGEESGNLAALVDDLHRLNFACDKCIANA